ncbi:hybrid sensor histidine kinase/response regulator [Leptospira kmetyi]|uniref:histidine kinase n=1 Tax=Leptospira kmetyi TaxID=408139 RepID=A0A2M9XRR1_9LEPT|nr:PAS domain S-box protein [Leptospira kmetyi]AYV56237.1 PAS domain S-box protein [Leptospira kmetyi]EQA53065.1 PAS domain S-box protein [Leptospira kmetyi serovar Malaysia str. Bejo-Iso9]PJZ29892.1 hybrid sensor histidine kinase/response regulator [Leptospira kmetyi]PJZ41992.1 hybrid sensor histidine kinase/response regulator [Leptospira kmetyi]TGK15940.1 PAS domain S-box protein [Leptospira kmetyi]
MIHHYIDTATFSKKETASSSFETFFKFLTSPIVFLKTFFRNLFLSKGWLALSDSEEQRKVELLLDHLFQVFEELSEGKSLSDILATLALAIEKYRPNIHASILLLDKDGVTLRHRAAPSLPKEYCALVDGEKIGPKSGSCGTAAYTKQLTIVEDIQTDPLWEKYSEIANRFHLRACWSHPILSPSDQVLGTFALYYYEPKKPSDLDLRLIHSLAHIAGIAIERKRIEDLKTESEARYRSLVEQASDTIFLTDKEGRYIEINPSGCALLGYTKEEFLKLHLWDVIDPDDLKKQPLRVNDLKAGKPVLTERKLVRKDGSIVPVEINARYLENGFLQGIVRNISERKITEEIVRQAQKMESLGLLAGGIAHDFNNLLTMILGSAEVMELRIDKNSDLNKHVTRIIEAAKRGGSITKQLLLFSRPGSSELKPVSISHIIKEVTDILAFSLPKNITIETKIDLANGIILGDSGHLHQVILNLALNARDAMPDGGKITIQETTVSGDEVRKKFLSGTANQYVCIHVIDTGKGMDSATKDKIFEPFFTTKERGKGTGLGLSIVDTITKNHFGFIDVESFPNRGTKFHLYFPAIAAGELIDSETIKRQTKIDANILIVDDEIMVLDVLKDILELSGCRVFSANNGKHALEIYQDPKNKIDLVISDLGMPDMSGDVLFTKLKNFDPSVKVIITSGHIEREKKEKMLEEGVKNVLDKPYKIEAVQTIVQEIIKTL